MATSGGGSSVLREYLVSLGFRVNQTESKKFEDGLARWDKRANQLAIGLVGVGVAATAAVAKFAYSMEKLYYSSKRTDSAVSSIQALEFGASKIGVSGDKIRGSLEALARNLRSNPGLQGLLNSLGVQVTGRDKADVLTDLVGQLKKMPFYVAEKYANLFGIDPDTLYMLEAGLDDMRKAQAERKQMAQDMGVDADAAAKASKDLANAWRDVAAQGGLFVDQVLIAALPLMQSLAEGTKGMLQAFSLGIKDGNDWMKIQDDGWRNVAGAVHMILADWREITSTGKGSLFQRFGEGTGLINPGGRESGVELSKESKARLGMAEAETSTPKRLVDRWLDKFGQWGGGKRWKAPLADEASVDAAQDDSAFKRGGTGPRNPPAAAQGGGQPSGAPGSPTNAAALFARLEKQYALPPGTLDRIWSAESNRGDPRYMRSGAGAKGHMGFMDATAKEQGVKDPDDLEDSAAGAAKYYAQLLKKYGGDSRKAAAAYNWGMGNVDSKGLGAAPRETRDYMDKVGGAAAPTVINQENNVIVHGTDSPQATAAAVRDEMKSSNADVVRNMRSVVN